MATRLPIPIEWAATLLFVVAGIAGLWLAPGPLTVTAATALFYAVLLVNTYFSIRFFNGLPPEGRDERVVDGALVAIYVALGLTIGRALPFAFLTLMLFAVAIAKYQLMKPMGVRRDILDGKIAIDACGLLLCTLATAGVWLGYPEPSVWAQAIVFALANVYLLAIKPMYAA